MTHQVVLFRGDGIGPEIAEAAQACIDATGVAIEWHPVEAGEAALQKHGTPLPDFVLEKVRECGVALKSPITTPVASGFRSVNVALRQALDLYACVRPCKAYPGIVTPFQGVDLVIVRENTEDLYAGIEFARGTDDQRQLVEFVKQRQPDAAISDDCGISVKPISAKGSRRIVAFAFEYARKNGRRLVTAVHKANIMKHSDGLFLEVARNVARHYPDVAYSEKIVDNMCMQLVQHPHDFDVLVMPNLYGDILSDLAAGLVGGLGVAPGANLGHKGAVFEATHGSAPDIAGQNKANPTALLLSGVLMLRHLGERDAAERLERAVAAVIADGTSVTPDLRHGSAQSRAGTREMADAVIERVRRT